MSYSKYKKIECTFFSFATKSAENQRPLIGRRHQARIPPICVAIIVPSIAKSIIAAGIGAPGIIQTINIGPAIDNQPVMGGLRPERIHPGRQCHRVSVHGPGGHGYL